MKFWDQFISLSNLSNQLFTNNSPSKESWIGKGLGIGGVSINLVISNSYCRSEVFFNRGRQEDNKEIFDFIYKMKDKVESEFDGKLNWERMDDKVTCRLKSQLDGVSYFEASDWNTMNEFLINTSVRMERAFKDPIKKLSTYLKNRLYWLDASPNILPK